MTSYRLVHPSAGRTAAPALDSFQQSVVDHEGGPLGLCRHPVETDPVELQTHTAFAAHLELDAKRFSYTWGPPCESEFATVSL